MSLTLQRRGLVDEYNGYQFRRESMAQDSAGKLIYPHNARFEQGPFGSDKAILVEEGTENLVNLRTWNPVGETPQQIVSATDKTFRGFPVYKAQKKTTGTPPISLGKFNIPAGETITASIWVNAMDSVDHYPRIFFYKEGVVGKDFRDVKVGEWGRLTTTYTNDTDEIIEGVFAYFYPSIPVDSITYFSSPQVEWGPYATTFTPSVRADEEIIIPTAGLLSPEQGTIEFDFKIPISPTETGMHCYLLRDFFIHSANEQFYFRTGGSPRFRVRPLINEWNRLALVFENNDLNTVALFLNGSKYEISEVWPGYTSLPDWWTTLNIFARVSSSSASTKYISNLRLSSIARTQEQLAPIDAPPTVDEYTTLYLPFNGPDNVRAAKVVTL